MEAVILAGGFGTRLRAVVPDLPKPMAPIAGRPFLEILLNSLSAKGFQRAVLSLGYRAASISTHFGHRFADMELSYVVEETPLGTGGATRLAFTRCESDHAFIFNGDTFLDLEATAIEQLWQKRKHHIIVGREVPDTQRYGRLLVDDGRVTGFTEKGISGPGLINAGCYVLDRDALFGWPPATPFSLEADHFAKAVTTQRVDCFVTHGLFIDIGIPEDFLRAQSLLASLA